MRKIATTCFVSLSLLLAVAAMAKVKRYDVQFSEALQASGVKLNAGTYQVEMDGNSILFFKHRKQVAKVPVKTEQLQNKNGNTSVTTEGNKLIALQFAGTKTKLVVQSQ